MCVCVYVHAHHMHAWMKTSSRCVEVQASLPVPVPAPVPAPDMRSPPRPWRPSTWRLTIRPAGGTAGCPTTSGRRCRSLRRRIARTAPGSAAMLSASYTGAHHAFQSVILPSDMPRVVKSASHLSFCCVVTLTGCVAYTSIPLTGSTCVEHVLRIIDLRPHLRVRCNMSIGIQKLEPGPRVGLDVCVGCGADGVYGYLRCCLWE